MLLFRNFRMALVPQPPRPPACRWLRFGLRRAPACAQAASAAAAAGVRAPARAEPARWEDLLASHDRAA